MRPDVPVRYLGERKHENAARLWSAASAHPGVLALQPLALLYNATVRARRAAYDRGLAHSERVDVPVPEGAKVFIALGTIESARMALLSFPGIANYDQIGKNLMAHLRSNLTIRIKRESVVDLSPAVKALQASALSVKCKHDFSTDGIGETGFGYFHHQITAAGLDRPTGDSEAELFKKIPDIDTFDLMRRANVVGHQKT